MGNLVLSRYPGETVFVGDEIKITCVELRKSKVRLGFDAPQCVPITRDHPPGVSIFQAKERLDDVISVISEFVGSRPNELRIGRSDYPDEIGKLIEDVSNAAMGLGNE